MKIKYIAAALILIALGVVNTFAFNLNTVDTEVAEAYTIQTYETDATIDSIKLKPSKNGDVLIIQFQLTGTDTETYKIGIELEDNEGTAGLYDASGCSSTPSANSNSDQIQGYLEYEHTLDGTSDEIIIRIQKTGIWGDVDGVFILISGGDGGGTTPPQQYYTSYLSVDNHPETSMGAHSSFTAMQSQTPDAFMNTLTEYALPSTPTVTTLINFESFEGTWPPQNWQESPTYSSWASETDQAYDSMHSADFDGQSNGRSGIIYSPEFDCSDATSITLDFWYYDQGLESDEFLLEFFDGSNWDTILDLGASGTENTWQHYQATISDNQYMKGNFKIRWNADDVEGGETAYFDYVLLQKTSTASANPYQLDLEVEWTSLPQAANEYLCLYGGTQSAEGLMLEVWDGSDYVTLISDIQPGWNNVDVSAYHTGSTFNIRFIDTSQISDSTQSSWEIDSLFLEFWD